MEKSKPSPFDFDAPGKYLESAYRFKKEIEPGISHRYIAAAMGYKSAAAFHDIIKGRVTPNRKALDFIGVIFELNDLQIRHLALLFVLQNIRDPYYKDIITQRDYSGCRKQEIS